METIALRIAGTGAAQLPLAAGVNAIARGPDGAIVRVDDAQAAGVRFCVDRRGVWLTVGEEVGGVHVNGRPVRRMAMLRVGDSVHADGAEIVLTAVQAPARPPPAGRSPEHASGSGGCDPRIVLRGVGGRYHGRSFTLDRPRLVGSEGGCDIRIADPAFAAQHCRIDLLDQSLVLRDLGSEEGSLVNGHPVRDALLRPGDQIVFDDHERFVVEAPAADLQREQAPLPPGDGAAAGPAAMAQQAMGRNARRLPWLLLAAALIAAALSALLLFGASG